MPAKKGSEFLLKYDSGGGTMVTLGGGRTNQMSINNAPVDVTSQDDTSRWRQLLAGAGVRTLSHSSSMIFVDDAAQQAAVAAALADTHSTYEITIPDLGTFEFAGQINVQFAGDHDGEVTFEVSLESAGDVTFTAA
jgi:TP901-1 family phage major tail protein